MKNILILPAVFAAWMIFAENLLPNPEFTIQPGRAYPADWRISPNAVAQPVKNADGNMALELNTSTNGKRSFWQCHLKKIKAGANYRFSATVTGKAGVKGRIYTEVSKPFWQSIGSEVFTCTGKKQLVTFDFSFKPFTAVPYLVLRLDTPGQIQFSNIKIEKNAAVFIKNPGFKDLKHWSKGNNAILQPIYDKQKGAALRLKPNGKNVSMAIQRNLPLEAGQSYEFKVELKGTPGVKASAYLECSKPWKTFGSSRIICNGKWQQITIKFSFDELKQAPYLVLRIHGNNGEVIFANPKITAAEQSSVRNGHFEAGSAGWKINSGKIVGSGGAQKKVLELKDYSKPASAVQENISVKGGQMYRLSYLVRGGTDKRFTDSQNATWFRVAPCLNGKFLKNTEHFQDSFSAWFRKSVVFTPEKDCKIDIVCQLKEPGMIQLDDITLLPVKRQLPPVEIVLDFPYAFRESALTSHKEKISGSIITNISGISRCEVQFNGKCFKVKENKFLLDLPGKAGVYPLKVNAFDSKGGKIASASVDFTLRAPRKREITFRKDRIMLIDGVPFFPIGVWSIRGNKAFSEKMKLVAESGFNCARVAGDQVDDAAEYGLLTLVNTIERMPHFRNDVHKKIWMSNYFKGLQQIQNHPSLIGYCNSDEPAWRGVAPEPIISAYKLLRKFDPGRPVFLNEAPRGNIDDLRIYTKACDVYGVDIYPVPYPNAHSGLADKMMTSVGKYADICRIVTRNTKPVWMTLQAFSWNVMNKRPNGVYPTPAESRFMAYNAIVHGATGLLYWGFNAGNVENWDFFKTISITIRELRSMTGVFAGRTVVPAGMRSSSPDINILHKQVNGKNYYICINESGKKVVSDFSVSGKNLFVLMEKRSVGISSGKMTDTFQPWDVHVYSDTPAAPEPLPDIPTARVGKKLSFREDYRQATWIWYPGKNRINGHRAIFTREFNLDKLPEKTEFSITADDYFKLWINGKPVMEHNRTRSHGTASVMDVRKFLKKGKNIILIKAYDNNNAPCGLLYSLRLDYPENKTDLLISDRKTMAQEPGGSTVVPAQELGKFGCSPWGWQTSPQPALTNCGEIDFAF